MSTMKIFLFPCIFFRLNNYQNFEWIYAPNRPLFDLNALFYKITKIDPYFYQQKLYTNSTNLFCYLKYPF